MKYKTCVVVTLSIFIYDIGGTTACPWILED